ncbi:ribbon-helix-helix domain-containing protein [Fictibacillus sp. WQ 8-8]|uniref:Ribbon-helix-helix domain-containing protein n=1 Tax=Fictibacillus marinisediminis TaxID=2878389 RepID=A0A9X1XGW1_9BACL|nr:MULTISPECIES: ribbon-helix-helix domain-containing protein [Fictibacillus]SFD75731.1 Ribbon-helix-helix domain-containing protein [Bacillus sp. OV194]MCK6257429.1 ribbon-helix-helix domain-containing protein [Fictibacillus marinisediminis]MCQ6265943.1 ribbon-helix-helix domain-containing protein [Fictibacillus sp. WQ 8-8]MED2975075.1 ribbon-helix-helix domain-containing protein [Fictibacillus sp. B-59209]UZJ80911.1 ribbon-helix-helix domain-containing protein [Fictibacillus sp. KU28468]
MYQSSIRPKNDDRKNVNTTLSQSLYKELKALAAKLDRPANDLLEEGMRHVLEKYKNKRTSK